MEGDPMNTILRETDEKMKKVLEHLRQEFSGVRAGRANASILDNLRVEYYGQMVPINQVGSVSIPDARTIEIKPWDKTALAEIEKAINKSDIGLTPLNDGKVIRLNMPPLTQERRQELVKLIKKMTEEAKVMVRNIRRDGMDKVKEKEKEKQLTEDESKKGQAQLQKLTDDLIKKCDEVLAGKEKEILEV
jgi:ribosome recycling factor